MEVLGLGFSILSDRLLKFIVKRAVGLPADDIDLQKIVGSSKYTLMRKAVGSVASIIVTEKNGHLRCGLCGKGPFTRRGLYLHLIRIHGDEILNMVEEKYEELVKNYSEITWY